MSQKESVNLSHASRSFFSIGLLLLQLPFASATCAVALIFVGVARKYLILLLVCTGKDQWEKLANPLILKNMGLFHSR
jgi:hypothetical protein